MKIDYDYVAKQYQEAIDAQREWRIEAADNYELVAGHQWDEEDMQILLEQGRPAVTFNRMGIYIDGVCGLEKLNRQEIQFLPRGVNAPGASDIMTSAVKYIYDDQNGYSQESEAFWDMIITGMGWTSTYLDFSTNPDGDIAMERIDPLEMVWDPRARRRNLRDARWVMRIKSNTSEDEIKFLFPRFDLDEGVNGAVWDGDFGYEASSHSYSPHLTYKHTLGESGDRKEGYVLAEYQYYRIKNGWRVISRNGLTTISDEQYKQLKDQGIRGVRVPIREYRRAFFVGNQLIEEGPAAITGQFSFQAMTGRRDRRTNSGATTWYGLARPLRDPQLWVNKFFSSIQYQVATQAKGGLISELTAFENSAKAESEWARPDSIVWVSDGALSGANPRIMPKPTGDYPAALDRLMQVAMEMFRDVSGMSLELLGLAERNQPGILEEQRKQAGMTILAWAFDALTDYRKIQGRVLADFVKDYLADGRLIRISSDQPGIETIQLIRDNMYSEYDVVITESPKSVNDRERTFGVLAQLLPFLIKTAIPLPPDLVRYLPLPESLIQRWMQYIQEQAQAQTQGQEQTSQEDPRITGGKVEQLMASAALSRAKAQELQQKSQRETMKDMADVELTRAKAFRERGKALTAD